MSLKDDNILQQNVVAKDTFEVEKPKEEQKGPEAQMLAIAAIAKVTEAQVVTVPAAVEVPKEEKVVEEKPKEIDEIK